MISSMHYKKMNCFRSSLSSIIFGESAMKGIITLADQVLVSGTRFLVGIIIGRTCSKEQFGLFALGLTAIFLVIHVQKSLISSPYTYNVAYLKGSAKSQYAGSTLLHSFSLSLSTAALFLITIFLLPLISLNCNLARYLHNSS